MRKLICKVLTFGRHYFKLKDHRYRCIFCGALRYQTEPLYKLADKLFGPPVITEPLPYKVEPQEVKDEIPTT